jgi:extracellular solute-binding protein (family 5)
MLVLAAAVVACALAGPAVAPQSAAAGQKSTDWRMAFSDAIDFQANIFASFDATPYFIFTEVYDTLLNYNLKDGGPDLTNSPTAPYNVSKDGLVYTFHLRPGMRWSDGQPFTADDVVFSYEHAADSNVNSTRWCSPRCRAQMASGARSSWASCRMPPASRPAAAFTRAARRRSTAARSTTRPSSSRWAAATAPRAGRSAAEHRGVTPPLQLSLSTEYQTRSATSFRPSLVRARRR